MPFSQCEELQLWRLQLCLLDLVYRNGSEEKTLTVSQLSLNPPLSDALHGIITQNDSLRGEGSARSIQGLMGTGQSESVLISFPGTPSSLSTGVRWQDWLRRCSFNEQRNKIQDR